MKRSDIHSDCTYRTHHGRDLYVINRTHEQVEYRVDNGDMAGKVCMADIGEFTAMLRVEVPNSPRSHEAPRKP